MPSRPLRAYHHHHQLGQRPAKHPPPCDQVLPDPIPTQARASATGATALANKICLPSSGVSPATCAAAAAAAAAAAHLLGREAASRSVCGGPLGRSAIR